MNRISAGQVLAAFEKSGMVPIQESWLDLQGERKCACGLSAVYLAKSTEDKFEDLLRHPNQGDIVLEGLSLEDRYVNGFLHGFDGTPDNDKWSETAKVGWKDGRAAWEAVEHLVLTDGN